MLDPISTILMHLTKYFEQNSIPYVIVGGVAVIVTGRTRMTEDVDIILDHTKLDRRDFVCFLVEKGFDATEDDFEGFEENSHCTIFLKEGMFRIDIKGIYSQLDQESINMAISETFNGIPIKINHPLNTIVFKLKFGSEQDYEDALAVFIRNEEKIDNKKLRDKAKRMGIPSKLDKFLEEIKQFKNTL